MGDRTAVAVVPVLNPRHRLAGGEVLHLGAAAELSRSEPEIVTERPDRWQLHLIEVHDGPRRAAASAAATRFRSIGSAAVTRQPGKQSPRLRFRAQWRQQTFTQNDARNARRGRRKDLSACNWTMLILQALEHHH